MSKLLERMGFHLPSGPVHTFSSTESITKKNGRVNYPQLNVKVFFAGRCFFGGAVRMFQEAGCEITNTLEEAGLVIFLGGADINPSLYGERLYRTTSFDDVRDEQEIEIFLQAQALGIPMFGICRGMQLIHALAGGILWQHVHNHAGPDHSITDLFTGEKLMSTSLHHQMCIFSGPRNNKLWCIPVAKSTNTLSKNYFGGRSEMTSDKEMELEAAFYPEINAFGTQGHPEIGKYPDYTVWCLSYIEALIAGEPPAILPSNLPTNTGPWIPEEEADMELRAEIARTVG